MLMYSDHGNSTKNVENSIESEATGEKSIPSETVHQKSSNNMATLLINQTETQKSANINIQPLSECYIENIISPGPQHAFSAQTSLAATLLGVDASEFSDCSRAASGAPIEHTDDISPVESHDQQRIVTAQILA